jgi:cysteine-rich repeat protein
MPAAELLANLARQAPCFGGGMYVQDALVCPAPECGNGVREGGDPCDDGNRRDGDDCSATCSSV